MQLMIRLIAKVMKFFVKASLRLSIRLLEFILCLVLLSAVSKGKTVHAQSHILFSHLNYICI